MSNINETLKEKDLFNSMYISLELQANDNKNFDIKQFLKFIIVEKVLTEISKEKVTSVYFNIFDDKFKNLFITYANKFNNFKPDVISFDNIDNIHYIFCYFYQNINILNEQFITDDLLNFYLECYTNRGNEQRLVDFESTLSIKSETPYEGIILKYITSRSGNFSLITIFKHLYNML